MLQKVNCNLCGQTRTKAYFKSRLPRLRQCENCDLVYTNPRLSKKELFQIYNQNYFISQKGGNIFYLNYLKDKKILTKNFERRLRNIEKYQEPGRLLDIGAALGFFMLTAQKRGWETYGLDISPYTTQIAEEKFGLKIENSELKKTRFPTNYFDLVTMWDVIEHLPDPTSDLTIIWQLLKKEGLLVISTPDIDSWAAKILGHWWPGFGNIDEHIYYFSSQTLSQMLCKIGFEVLKIGYLGKSISGDTLIKRIAPSSPLASVLKKLYQWTRGRPISIYINPFDTLYLYARKK